jgi:GTP cyclohydrolase I|tara:strand:+ start:3251 stop:3892 length:642 start_codon:yes stop_codon:yes gene_type:complete
VSTADLGPDISSLSRKLTLPARKISRADAEEAVKTLIIWLGDDPSREGLHETPARVTKAFSEWFSGYQQNPEKILQKTFAETGHYKEPVILRGIRFESFCEHHMAPITGVAHISYLPDEKIVGLSKLARIVDVYAKRLQVQERMTAQIADAVQRYLNPQGVAVMIFAEHHCMSTRGVRKHDVDTITSQYTGVFRADTALKAQFIQMVVGHPPE